MARIKLTSGGQRPESAGLPRGLPARVGAIDVTDMNLASVPARRKHKVLEALLRALPQKSAIGSIQGDDQDAGGHRRRQISRAMCRFSSRGAKRRIGDLIGLEAQRAGLTGIVIWGCHRDSAELRDIGIPIFSLGSNPCGPLSVHDRDPQALVSARVEDWTATSTDVIVGDPDGVIAIPSAHLAKIVEAARKVRDTETEHSRLMRDGKSFRTQVRFGEFLERRGKDPSFTFRRHLRGEGGSIEE